MIILVAAVSVFGANKVVDMVTGLFSDGSTSTLSEGDISFRSSHGTRSRACPRSFPKKYGGQCDEYPMAVTDEVPGRENSCQGGMYGAQYPKQEGARFLVVIIHPEQIATTAFSGADIAKDQGFC